MALSPRVRVAFLLLVFFATGTYQQTTTTVATAVANPLTAFTGFDLTVCGSATAGFITTVSVQSLPTGPIDVILIPGTHREFLITCIRVQELINEGNIADADKEKCDLPVLFYVCHSYAAEAPTDDADWTCTLHTEYQFTPASQVLLGSQTDEPKHIKVQWYPVGRETICFPSALTAQMVGAAIIPRESDLFASIIFIMIVGAILLLAGSFILYQFRKVMRKFWKKQIARPTTHLSEMEHRNTMKAIGVDSSLPPPSGTFAAELEEGSYDEDADRGGGGGGIRRLDDADVEYYHQPTRRTNVVVANGGTMEVESSAMPLPWFKAHNYDNNHTPGRKNTTRNYDVKEKEDNDNKNQTTKKKKKKLPGYDDDSSSSQQKGGDPNNRKDGETKQRRLRKQQLAEAEEEKKKEKKKMKELLKGMKKPDNKPVNNSSMKNYPFDKKTIESIRYDEEDEVTPVRSRIYMGDGYDDVEGVEGDSEVRMGMFSPTQGPSDVVVPSDSYYCYRTTAPAGGSSSHTLGGSPGNQQRRGHQGSGASVII